MQRPGHERLQGLTRLKKVHEIFCLKHVEQFSLCCTSSISFNLKVFFWVVWKLNYLIAVQKPMKGFTASRSTGIDLPDMRERYLSRNVNIGERFAEDPRKTR